MKWRQMALAFLREANPIFMLPRWF